MKSADTTERYSPFRWRQADPSQLAGAEIRTVHDAWHEDTTGGKLPLWRIGVLENLPNGILPFANVIDTANSSPPFAYRFFGSGLANMHTFELSARTTDAIEPEGFRNLCVDQHLMVIEERKPLVFINRIPTRTPSLFLSHTMLRLPYSSDGRTVSQILTLEELEQAPHETWERFRIS